MKKYTFTILLLVSKDKEKFISVWSDDEEVITPLVCRESITEQVATNYEEAKNKALFYAHEIVREFSANNRFCAFQLCCNDRNGVRA